MKLPFTNQAGDDVGSLISNPQVDERFEPRHLGSYVVVSRRARAAGNRKSAIANHQSRSGIALVITLILLSVTLVMAVAFLAISNRERSSVTTTTDATTARLAAETALAQAEGQIISTMLATTNPYNYGLLVSTNYINGNGFDPAAEAIAPNPTNVNYDYLTASAGGGPPSLNQIQQTIANLFFSPRAPVFIVTNQSSGASDFRFYLDLNRNGRFETNGYSPMFSSDPVLPYVDTNGFNTANLASAAFNNFVGDPEWIGVLERPDTTHGPNNKFLSRYAFVALPVGNTLDVNYIHNAAFNPTAKSQINTSGGDFRRNEGVGGWEINLAAFFHDLNTNSYAWGDLPLTQSGYFYDPLVSGTVSGSSFVDAMEFYRYRLNGLRTGFLATDYAYNTAVLNSVNNLFGTIGDNAFSFDQIDGYSDGPFMTTNTLPFDNDSADINYPWPGADNANHFFTPGEFFDPAKTSGGALGGFTNRLLIAGSSPSTYDRYTFYRMLSQLGTDSSPESGLMNVNYDNLDPGFNGVLNVNGTASVTNFVPWTAIGFFTNAADRMLRLYTTNWFYASLSFTNQNTVTTNSFLAAYYGLIYTNQVTVDQFGQISGLINAPYSGMTNQVPSFGITHIPVYIYGQFVYSPAVQRLLQLAANIYDATTNSFYPSVFRPTFFVTNEFGFRNVYINGYEPIEFSSAPGTSTAPLDIPVDVTSPFLKADATVSDANGNAYGVPWIIGAKKGFPNFNEFSMQDAVQVTRKLQLTRPTTNSPPDTTNQMYVFSITNSLGVECWNSYTNAYPFTNALSVTVRDSLFMQLGLTNGTMLQSANYLLPATAAANISVWPGRRFVIPLTNSVAFLPDAAYKFSPVPSFIPESINPTFADVATTPSLAPLPQILLSTTNRLQAFMLDNNHVIDYVQFAGPDNSRNLNSEFLNANTSFSSNPAYYTNGVWSTALNIDNIPLGIATQIQISDGRNATIGVVPAYWVNKTPTQIVDERNGFAHFLNSTNSSFGSTNFANDLAVQAPYTPTINVYQYTTWQANDPLVHYLQSDLNYSGYDPNANSIVETGIHQVTPTTGSALPILPDLGTNNVRYQPWGVKPPPENGISAATYDESPYNLAFKDPLVKRSDNWDFPTNKFPGVGWIGRVHRGTPWQTIYLKASNILRENSGFGNIGTNTWSVWTGDTNIFDAANTAPFRDRLLFDIFTSAPDDNATRGQLSVNVGAVPGGTSLASWSALFSGMVVLTNTTVFPQFFAQTNLPVIIQPAGLAFTNSTLGKLAVGINNMRSTFTNADGVAGTFEHLGDILSTPQLTQLSPFLNTAGVQITNGISDELYEWLPQQAMSLLRAPSAPRYVIYCYGQALKPAQNSILTGGTFFQMCTNYQVVTESAARAVIRVEDATTPHPHIVVESFNLLPPD